ncbi:NAD-dependent epimerase/dehydratase family protein [Amycolatopsis rhizosphaerae]|uniref:NAD-dependent epimerase/dehydratase family protein n=1 Tax=Amycolatopsis rhizosphaerae TaxID=2053003 RepID=A0A558DIW3_9PSEU|nr:NAD-dependent epimerase/dehydratase family protein [Amycolatopsis rhizosphaerae]TVT60944.1 NAD-dependent epimerase/dehydratase family protein [Amycolatopsis rhizosphaerae]
MDVFLTGASGYIGGAVAQRLIHEGHTVRGLTRTPGVVDALAAAGIEPVVGDLDDAALLEREARRADAVVNTAHSDHRGAVDTFIGALRGSGKILVHTSGTSVIGDDAQGQSASTTVFDDAVPFSPGNHEIRRARHAIDTTVVDAGGRGLRTVVLCNSLIYGNGTGPRPQTVLIPPLVTQAFGSGTVRVVGRGLNRWSTVHLDDMADLYHLALTEPEAAGFYFVEGGEDASFAEIGQAIARRLGLGPVEPWDLDSAAAVWGEGFTRYALGANSRVRATRARALGWRPSRPSIAHWIEHDMPLP